jgi:EAL domain-containing protein (putative c-di-GMP-specific phosphodiesterase class I)
MSGKLSNDVLTNIEINHFYQPIFHLYEVKPLGFEALIRTTLSPIEYFGLAIKSDRLYKADTASFSKALLSFNFSELRENKIFLNVFPSTLSHYNFIPFLDELLNTINHRNIVIEINEAQNISNYDSIIDSISELRKRGIRVGIDDVGSGMNPFQRIVEFEPDYIKLDKYFSDDLAILHNKQKLVEMFVLYCDSIGSKLVLEGIETPEDLHMAKELGIILGQGYVLAKPSPIENIINFRSDIDDKKLCGS